MASVTGSLGRPIQGISQQPLRQRLEGQCTDSVNLVPDVVAGLRSRAGLIWTDTLVTGYGNNPDDLFYHSYEDSDGLTILTLKAEGATTFSATSTATGAFDVSVSTENGDPFTYLRRGSTSPEKFEAVTIADTTVIVNKDVKVLSSGDKTPKNPNIALVYCQFATYGRAYSVYINDSLVMQAIMPDGSQPTHSRQVDTVAVASGLEVLWTKPSGFTLTRVGSVLIIEGTSSFTIRTEDGADGGDLIALKGHTTDPSKLPPYAPEGYVVEIRSKGQSDVDAYWLKAVKTDNESDVRWKETLAPDIAYAYDTSTLPVIITRISNTEFQLKRPKWVDRLIGNDKSNPYSAFVGQYISSAGLFQNRLYFTSPDCISMSCSGDYFNFFRETTQTIIDTDPVELASDTGYVSNFRASVGFDGDLVLFSDRGQHIISGESVVTPNNLVPVRTTTNFDMQEGGKAISCGESVMFPYNYGSFTGIREYFTDSVVDTKRARPVTEHVNQLMLNKVKRITSSSSLNQLVIQLKDDPVLYVYNWLWQGNEKVQSAWGRWRIHDTIDIEYMQFLETRLYIVFTNSDDSLMGGSVTKKIGYIEGDMPDSELGLTFNAAMDYQWQAKAVRRSDGDWNVISLSDQVSPLLHFQNHKCILVSGCHQEYVGVEVDLDTDNHMFRDEDYSDLDEMRIILGYPMAIEYAPSLPYPKSDDGTASTGLNRMQIGCLYVNYESAGDCKSYLTTASEQVIETYLYPRVIGAPSNIVGFAKGVAGVFKIPIRTKFDKYTWRLTTESHIPFKLREIEYTGSYSPRKRTMR